MNMPRVKQENRSLIFRCILEQGPISRKDIARLTGLTPAAVTQLCAELLSEGLLAECGTQPQGAGLQDTAIQSDGTQNVGKGMAGAQSAKPQSAGAQNVRTQRAETHSAEMQDTKAKGAALQIAETGKRGAGRKKILLNIDFASRHLLAVSLGVETTFIAVSDLKGERLCRTSLPTDRSIPPEEFLARVAGEARAMLERDGTACAMPERAQKTCEVLGCAEKPREVWKCAEKPREVRGCAEKPRAVWAHTETSLPRLWGVSVTVPGAVDKERGLSLQAYGLWDRPVEVCRLLGDALGLPVCIENNVNAFAVAELLYGAGRKYDNLLLVKWGPGVGSAIITDGRLYEGRHGKAAELGHFIVERGGALCRCGRRGCLETKVSWQALCRKTPFLPERFGEAYRRAAAAGGNGAGAFDDAIDLFARTIVNSMTILAPNRVVLCGPMFRDALIRQKLTDACCAYDAHYDAQRILYSALAEKEEAIGPAAVFAQTVF